jgi:hypothetical protein
MAATGTTRLCPDVRDQGEYWRVSGLTTDIAKFHGERSRDVGLRDYISSEMEEQVLGILSPENGVGLKQEPWEADIVAA